MIAAALALALAAQAQSSAGATVVVRGHVTGADGRPLGHAHVTVTRAFTTTGTATDEDGSYELILPPGPYHFVATKAGYSRAEFPESPTSTAGGFLPLRAGQVLERVDFVMKRYGAIVGRVLDDYGDPVEGVSVTAYDIRFVSGQRQLAPVPDVALRRTNELGRYRLWGLQPGEYVVAASVGNAAGLELPGYAITFAPVTASASEAQRVRVRAAEDVSVDITLVRTRTARISGTTIDSNGVPFLGGIRMRTSVRFGMVSTIVGARTYPDGRFEFLNVAPGEYVLEAFKGNELGWRVASVNGTDIRDITVQTMAGSTVRGRIVWDGAAGEPPPSMRLPRLSVVPADPDLRPFASGGRDAEYRTDRDFEISRIPSASRFVVSNVPRGWMVKSIRQGDRDITDAVVPFGGSDQSLADISIVFTDQVTEIGGTVDSANADRPAFVLLFPVDPGKRYSASRYFAVVHTSADGRFSIAGVPGGDYFVAAVDRLPGREGEDAWQDPAYLERIEPGATRVIATDGEHASVTITIVPRSR